MNEPWRQFIEGNLFADDDTPWRDDPAYQLLLQLPGLRDSVGGQVAPALTQAIGLVQALARVNLLDLVRSRRPAQGLSLGFGMNVTEPHDLLHVFDLDCVHGYEWIREHIIEAAQSLSAFQRADPTLPSRLRLHHGTMSDLSALADRSVRVIYVANVFNPEIPMAQATFTATIQEILRVLEPEGIVLSRGSVGIFEETLAPRGRMLLQNPLISVFQRH
jgi:hypothetical protein